MGDAHAISFPQLFSEEELLMGVLLIVLFSEIPEGG